MQKVKPLRKTHGMWWADFPPAVHSLTLFGRRPFLHTWDRILMCIVSLMCRCGAQSIREEEFTNLSLDLVPGGSVQQMLEEYQTVRPSCSLSLTSTLTDMKPGGTNQSVSQTFLSAGVFMGVCWLVTLNNMLSLQETELDYNCECGGQTSGQRSTFLTLPR